MKNLIALSLLIVLGSSVAEAKLNKEKCEKLVKKFSIIGSESQSGPEAQRLEEFRVAAQTGTEKEKNKTEFCAMYFAQVSFVEANYKAMRDEKCDSFEQYNIPWKTASDHLKNRFRSDVDIFCNKENKPGFGSSKSFSSIHESYMKYYNKMLGEAKPLEKSMFKFW